jgi:hypothetical protein
MVVSRRGLGGNGNLATVLPRIADAIVESTRQAYALDRDTNEAYAATWRKYKKQGVSREAFLAARDLAQPRLAELFRAYTGRPNEAALEGSEQLDKPRDPLTEGSLDMPADDRRRPRLQKERELALRARAEVAATVSITMSFSGRGLSHRTIDALVQHGIDAPERLLFMTETDLKNIPGVGKAALKEMMHYRLRFIPRQ